MSYGSDSIVLSFQPIEGAQKYRPLSSNSARPQSHHDEMPSDALQTSRALFGRHAMRPKGSISISFLIAHMYFGLLATRNKIKRHVMIER